MSLYYKIKRRLFPVEDGNPDFIPQFRLEGRSRVGDSDSRLEMRIADPLWMLGRQWQFGEFIGEDNGSPVSAKTNYRKESLNSYSFRGQDKRDKIGNIPLEARVEAVRINPHDLRSKVRIGQKIEAMIRRQFTGGNAEELIRRLRTTFPLQAETKLDQQSRAFFNLMAGNVTDGGALWAKIQLDRFPDDDFRELGTITDQLKSWYKGVYTPEGEASSWRSDQLVHEFSVHGDLVLDLHAPDYQGGHLDWYSFDEGNVDIDPSKQSTDSDEYMPKRVGQTAY